MPDEQIQINNLYHKLGHTLIDSGITFCRKSCKLAPRSFTREQVLTFLTDQLGIGQGSISLADQLYYIENWSKWLPIIEYDLLDKQIYQPDFRDCDNFAAMYSARASMIYGLNSCALTYGNIYDINTKKLLFRHAFNLIIVHENGTLKLKLYEPQTDESNDWRKGQENALQQLGWIYKPDWLLIQ